MEEKSTRLVGILSLNVHEYDNNWGSVLQSWALQEQLKRLGVPNTIVNYKPSMTRFNRAKYPFFKNFPFHFKRLFELGIYDLLDWNKFVRRDNKFQRFIKQHYSLTKKCNKKTICSIPISNYLVGSDIVWSDGFWGELEPAYFCNIGSMKSKKNIAYAPSISSNGFSKENESSLPLLLNNFASISVREPSKVNYLQQFTDKPVSSAIDPTLLLDETDYEPFLLDPLLPENEYVLVYCVSQNEELIRFADDYCKKHNLKLVTIKCCSAKKTGVASVNFDDAGIEEWLTLIKHANLVLTTSFHACIFSILFKKRFYAVYGDFAKSKISDLLAGLGLDNFSNKLDEEAIEGARINYDGVQKNLEKKREASVSFLVESFKQCGVL